MNIVNDYVLLGSCSVSRIKYESLYQKTLLIFNISLGKTITVQYILSHIIFKDITHYYPPVVLSCIFLIWSSIAFLNAFVL